MNSKHFIIVISVIGIMVSGWLIYNEIAATGFCPSYPLLGVPTCYLVLLFFSLILCSQIIKKIKISSYLFYTGAIWGLMTAIWFSINQLLGNAQCPVLLGIPQCYVAFITFIALILLAGSRKRS
ncbi:hypothetical protein ACFLU5_17225 [Bacteroidota bacterium]